MNKKDWIALNKIVKEIDVIEELLVGYSNERFLMDDRTQRAIAMTLINIGELVKVLSMDLRTEYSEVSWKAVAGMRDIVAHKYQSLRMEDIWITIQNDIPVLKEQLNGIIDKEKN
jgi:uncharacterized protein with HEPN domain